MCANLIPVVFADDLPRCELCGEPYCNKHGMHYADCTCIGPDNIEEHGVPVVVNNVLYCKLSEGQLHDIPD